MSVTGVEIKEFETLEVLAVAVAIYEYNDGYLKTSENYTDEQGNITTKWSNREILRHQFLVDYHSGDRKPPLIKVTDAHIQRAQEIRAYTKKEIFNVLANKESYSTNLYEVVNRVYVTGANFGFVASAPFYFKYSTDKDYYKEKIKNLNSQHVAHKDSKVHLDNFEVIRNSKSNNYPGYVIQGICEGNLYLFFTKYDSFGNIKVGSVINIEGKVKDHVFEQGTIPMTKLNRVYERITHTPTSNKVVVLDL